MKLTSQWATAFCWSLLLAKSQVLASNSKPSVHTEDIAARQPGKRSVSDSPTNGYAPGTVNCPGERPIVRQASSLSSSETAWLDQRRKNTVSSMQDLLSRLRIKDFDAAAYMNLHRDNVSSLPNVALAFSGGGYRAMLSGGGALKAFDSRTEGATGAGQLGGLLQSSTYIAGLSGGSWLVGSIYVNNFTSVAALQAETSGSLWELGNSILEGPAESGISILNTASYYKDIVSAVSSKEDKGFDTTVTDYWGRALSYQLINATDGGPGFSWSSIAEDSQFSSAMVPMPIVIADGRAPGETVVPSNTTVFEFNPWEFGSFDPTTYGFVPLRFLGSAFSGGNLPDNESCIRGFDNAGYVMGTSSTLFNQFLLEINDTKIPDIFKNGITKVLTDVSSADDDIADYSPNPFFHWNNESNLNAQSKRLTLVDGGEDLQNIPLHPLIQPVRKVDVIFAVDSSADTSNWPNATALVASYNRSVNAIENGTSFPAIPDQNTIVNLGLNTHPTFFGCNSSNTTGPAPLIVYIPNFPYVYNSNISTFTTTYTDAVRDAVILNGYNVATVGNGTQDNQWPQCVGCAILSRSMERTGTAIPTACTQCFERYCWNGTIDSSTPTAYDPKIKLPSLKVKTSNAQKALQAPLTWVTILVAGLGILLA